jgi:anti-sigma-K factor RskA
MTGQSERMARAGNYVLGLLEEVERERAERDLEIDPAFREAVVEIAERMHMFDLTVPAEEIPDSMWKAVAERIAGMPQMQPTFLAEDRTAAEVTARAAGAESSGKGDAVPVKVRRRRPLLAALALIAVFIAGYAAGAVTGDRWPPPNWRWPLELAGKR